MLRHPSFLSLFQSLFIMCRLHQVTARFSSTTSPAAPYYNFSFCRVRSHHIHISSCVRIRIKSSSFVFDFDPSQLKSLKFEGLFVGISDHMSSSLEGLFVFPPPTPPDQRGTAPLVPFGGNIEKFQGTAPLHREFQFVPPRFKHDGCISRDGRSEPVVCRNIVPPPM